MQVSPLQVWEKDVGRRRWRRRAVLWARHLGPDFLVQTFSAGDYEESLGYSVKPDSLGCHEGTVRSRDGTHFI